MGSGGGRERSGEARACSVARMWRWLPGSPEATRDADALMSSARIKSRSEGGGRQIGWLKSTGANIRVVT